MLLQNIQNDHLLEKKMNNCSLNSSEIFNLRYLLNTLLLYEADTWSMTVASSRRRDAFDQWCLRRIVHIQYTAHITNEEVRHRTGQPPVTSVIAKRRLRLVGHLTRADPSQDHSRIL